MILNFKNYSFHFWFSNDYAIVKNLFFQVNMAPPQINPMNSCHPGNLFMTQICFTQCSVYQTIKEIVR